MCVGWGLNLYQDRPDHGALVVSGHETGAGGGQLERCGWIFKLYFLTPIF